MLLYNTLTRQKEEFKPINSPKVSMYCCGPTVYDYQHIGNMRTYIFEDILKRTLKYNKYKVKHIMNITDIGHLVSDADEGEDKMMKALKRENLPATKKSMLKLADKYTNAFQGDLKKLNIQDPNKYTKATKHIKEQIKLVQILINKGYTYETADGIYFDSTKYADYAKLALLDGQELQAGKRVDLSEKKDIHDFALWKFSQANENRIMEWKAFGKKGFPGWHIECSAMSMKYLGEHFDIHCGGIDHIPVHHTNERAQNNCATGIKESVNFWMHGEFLVLDKAKMSKSAGSFIILRNAINKGISPLAYRYFCLMTHYRKPLSFSWSALESAQNGLDNLYYELQKLGNKKGNFNSEFKRKLLDSMNDDLNMPQILALIFEVLKSNLKNEDKLTTILEFDKVLGLNLNKVKKEKINIPLNIKNLAEQRLKV
ncbi:cysteine--tRNA ligase, partial [bacterium]|nr:cysteine--tRNA ligase [bacterium]